jgi:hypothetical protein
MFIDAGDETSPPAGRRAVVSIGILRHGVHKQCPPGGGRDDVSHHTSIDIALLIGGRSHSSRSAVRRLDSLRYAHFQRAEPQRRFGVFQGRNCGDRTQLLRVATFMVDSP